MELCSPRDPGTWPWRSPGGILLAPSLEWHGPLLYPIMGLASWLVWADGGLHKQGYPLMLYAIQLVLNLAWPALFFGAHAMGLALVDIILLVIVLALTVSAFQPVNHVAGHLMKPYLAWVTFAALLNLTLFWKNRWGLMASTLRVNSLILFLCLVEIGSSVQYRF